MLVAAAAPDIPAVHKELQYCRSAVYQKTSGRTNVKWQAACFWCHPDIISSEDCSMGKAVELYEQPPNHQCHAVLHAFWVYYSRHAALCYVNVDTANIDPLCLCRAAGMWLEDLSVLVWQLLQQSQPAAAVTDV